MTLSPDCDAVARTFGHMLLTLNPHNARIEGVLQDMLCELANRDEALADAFEARVEAARNDGP